MALQPYIERRDREKQSQGKIEQNVSGEIRGDAAMAAGCGAESASALFILYALAGDAR